MGFTPSLVTGAWVGFDDLRTLGWGETGAKAALPIWLEFMKTAIEVHPPAAEFQIPRGVTFARIDKVHGKLADKRAENSIVEPFIQGTEPTERGVDVPGGTVESQSDFFKEDFE